MLMLGVVLVAGALFDLLLLINWFWEFRFGVVLFSSLLHILAAILLLPFVLNPLSIAVLLVLLFRLINNARIYHGRLNDNHLRAVAQKSLASLILLQLLATIILYVSGYVEGDMLLLWIASAQLVGSLILLAFIVNSLHQTSYHGNAIHFSDKELPSVTVAIPARNETEDLQACIDSVLSSNYPKLEVLVLDDCSQDKTPDIIKQYAHAGVRFLQGTASSPDWLAKNHAYHQLADEASGQYLLFAGVDVRMSTNFIRNLVTHMKTKKKRMISVMPTRLGGNMLDSFIQPMRYWWELALPRKFLNRPAVLSTCWIIEKKIFNKYGGFGAVKRNILPERYFARECVADDTYTFIRSNEWLDLRTVKQPKDQVETAYRVLYPQFKKQPENILLLVVVLQVLLFMPYVLFISSFFVIMPLIQILSALTIIVLTTAHIAILTISNPANNIAGVISFPFVVLTETFLAIYSMMRYEFSSVLWKGRNVCIPVMNYRKNH